MANKRDLSNGDILNDLEWLLTQILNWHMPLFHVEYFGNGTKQKRSYNNNTNKNSYAIYCMVPFSMTLTNPNPNFKGHDILHRQMYGHA